MAPITIMSSSSLANNSKYYNLSCWFLYFLFLICCNLSASIFVAGNRDAPASLGNIGKYTTKLSIGTPPAQLTAMVDLTGVVTWVQCANGQGPSFNPDKSSTYKHASCSSTTCENLEDQICLGNDWCGYIIGQPDGSKATGNFSTDAFTITTTTKGDVTVPEMAFACGAQNAAFMGGKPVRLGVFDLTSRASTQFGFKYSHCFARQRSINDDADSHLQFGDDALIMLGNSTNPTSTPVDSCTLSKTKELYTITLEDISVGPQRLYIHPETFVSKKGCGVALESASAVTYLPKPALDRLVTTTRALTQMGSRIKPKDDFYPLCYEGTIADLAKDPSTFQTLTLHFKGGLDVLLKPLDLYVPVDPNTVCLLLSDTDDITTIGAYALQDKNVGYDFSSPTSNIVTIEAKTC